MGWQEIVIAIAFLAIVIVPGYWLYRDVTRLGGNPLPWVGAYAFAAVIPWRALFIPAVFVAWFMVRGWYRRRRRL